MKGYYATLMYSNGHYKSAIVAEDARPLGTKIGSREWNSDDDFLKSLKSILARPYTANEVLASTKRVGWFELHNATQTVSLSDESARELGWIE